ncbi:phospholipase B-like protein [Ochromonadaceae sp. CCMP2298]|nr:phospholipase B-like protein [Ochromonadaceae sp. CCMP2298]
MPRNTLFVVEQIPGLVLGTDVTDVLERGYWGSYNVPFHKQIYLESGYEVVDIAAGNIVGSEYQQAPRSKIFRRDAGAAVDLESMQQLMRYNQFQTDVYAEGDAWGAIAARGDLNKAPYAGGGYDTKVTSGGMFVKSQVSVVNGPTSQDQAPFRWSTSGLNDSHVGQPDVFDFQFELISL